MVDWIIQYWVQVVFGLIVSGGGILIKYTAKKYKDRQAKQEDRLKRQEDEQAILKLGVLGLLHDRLFQECKELIKSGEVSENDLENIETLYKSYSSLGGNGTGTELYNRVKKLRLKEDE